MWKTRTSYVHLDTGEVFHEITNKYIIIKKLKDERTFNKTTGKGTRNITYGIRDNPQKELF